MATIKIANLHPAGSELFGDTESYLNELTNEEINLTYGGSTPACAWGAAIATIGLTVGVAAWAYQVGRDYRRQNESRNGNVCYA